MPPLERAVERGAKVVLAARNGQTLEETLVGLRDRGGNATMLEIDVADDDAAERIAAHAVSVFGVSIPG